jgi:large subunit ribosomal protein L23
MSLDAHKIIKRPIITEKSTMLKELANKLVFEVDRRANKIEIKKAVEKVFKVKVDNVHTIRMKGKRVRYGRFLSKRPDWKKAVVTLAEGERVEYFDSV